MKKEGFTLFEIVITMTIIGILMIVLIPVLTSTMPDKNELRYKKANEIINDAMQELLSKDNLYLNGSLCKTALGEEVKDTSYFCNNLASVLKTKAINGTETNCQISTTTSSKNIQGAITIDNSTTTYETAAVELDTICSSMTTKDIIAKIETVGGITIFEANNSETFGNGNYCKQNDSRFKIICVDIDELNSKEPAFGYGINGSGKILYGTTAQEIRLKK